MTLRTPYACTTIAYCFVSCLHSILLWNEFTRSSPAPRLLINAAIQYKEVWWKQRNERIKSIQNISLDITSNFKKNSTINILQMVIIEMVYKHIYDPQLPETIILASGSRLRFLLSKSLILHTDIANWYILVSYGMILTLSTNFEGYFEGQTR